MPSAPADPGPALARVAPFFAELGLEFPAAPASAPDPFDDRLAAALESGASVLSFTMGTLPDAAVRAVKARGIANRFMDRVDAGPGRTASWPFRCRTP